MPKQTPFPVSTDKVPASKTEDRQCAADVLGTQGPFAGQLKAFTVRAEQMEMAAAIEKSIAGKQTLLAESGTGTGKTYAYLVPALLSGRKTLISTGTKHLQEQLFHRDIPAVLEALGASTRVSLLKGRGNYLCLYRLQQTRCSTRKLDKSQLNDIEKISAWVPHSKRGDIAELADVSESSRVWPMVTSTVDNCLGQGCSFFDDCYVNNARKTALASDLVVINHHLFFADKALKNDGFGALLPEVDTVIFDEAHQIPDIASHFLGSSFSSWQVMELTSDSRSAERDEKSLVDGLLVSADKLDKMVADQRLSFGLSDRRISWMDLCNEVPNLTAKMEILATSMQDFTDLLERAAVKGEGLARCYERALELTGYCQKIAEDYQDESIIRWVEIAKRSYRIHETPLDIGRQLNSVFGNTDQARIFTSATLSIDGDFSHFQESMGLNDDIFTATWNSPFDYYNQAVLYVPEGLPEPKQDGFAKAVFDAVLPVLEASQGRAFVLFTSFRIMQQFEQLLSEQDINVLMQGETNKRDLLREFIEKPNSVLLGTMSFWEGVDVPGEALSCVIIDKLPFESPFEPVLKARLNAMQQSGQNPFMDYQVPRAVITLRQGAGRLIRSQQDKGVLMICDARLRRTHYGKIFLNSLPGMRRSSDPDKVCGFLRSIRASSVRQQEIS